MTHSRRDSNRVDDGWHYRHPTTVQQSSDTNPGRIAYWSANQLVLSSGFVCVIGYYVHSIFFFVRDGLDICMAGLGLATDSPVATSQLNGTVMTIK